MKLKGIKLSALSHTNMQDKEMNIFSIYSKRIYAFTFFLLFLLSANAQNKVMKPMHPSYKNQDLVTVDSAYMRILYALNAVELNNPETYDDLQRLEIGTNISKYYSFYVFNSDSLITEWIKKNPKAQSRPRRLGPNGKSNSWSEYRYSEYFEDLANNTFTEYARMPMYMQKHNSKYTEKTPVQKWKISNGVKKNIWGYMCEKATCRFSGRNYTAWFTRDIPINSGPWKFRGLPGLILKVYDDDKLYTFECIRIENFNEKIPIKKYKDFEYYKIISRKDLLELQKKINEDFPKITGARNYKTKELLSTPSVYYPIEIE